MNTSAAYELPDFHPETGHRHHCENHAACDCAAWLYALAQQAEEALCNTPAATTAGTNRTTSGADHAESTTGHPSAPSTSKADPSALTASPGSTNPVPTGWWVTRRSPYDVAVYCSRCKALLAPNPDPLRAAQDHELDEHPDGWGETTYERVGQ